MYENRDGKTVPTIAQPNSPFDHFVFFELQSCAHDHVEYKNAEVKGKWTKGMCGGVPLQLRFPLQQCVGLRNIEPRSQVLAPHMFSHHKAIVSFRILDRVCI